MDLTSIATMAVAMKQAEAAQQMQTAMMKQALEQNTAAALQLSQAATQAAPPPGNAQVIDISV